MWHCSEKVNEFLCNDRRNNEKLYYIKSGIKHKAKDTMSKIDAFDLLYSRQSSSENSFHGWKPHSHVFRTMQHSSAIPKLSGELQNRKCVKLPEKRKNNKIPNQNISYESSNKILRYEITSSECYADRFGVPITMMNKAVKQRRKKMTEIEILKFFWLTQMGYNQPLSKDDSPDNDSIQNVKRLALICTPNFLVPTVKKVEIRKKTKIKNLQYARLNRINFLLNDFPKFNYKSDDHRNTTKKFWYGTIKSNALGIAEPRKEETSIYSQLRSKHHKIQHNNGFQVNMNFFMQFNL